MGSSYDERFLYLAITSMQARGIDPSTTGNINCILGMLFQQRYTIQYELNPSFQNQGCPTNVTCGPGTVELAENPYSHVVVNTIPSQVP